MTLVKRSPRTPADLFPSGLFRRFGDWPEPWADLFDSERIRVEEYRDGDTFVVRAEMPGIDPDKDVEIQVRDDSLVIRAQRRQEIETEEPQGYRSEFRYGSFTRTLALPAGSSESDVTATYQDGVLEVHVPVNPVEAKARTVPVTKR